MPAKLSDVAKKTGVAISTVSRILNRKSTMVRVSDETRRLVLAAAKEMDYRPSVAARSLVSGKTFTLGFICGDLQIPWFSEVAMGAMQKAEDRGYHLLVSVTRWNKQKELDCLDSLLQRRVDGILMCSVALRPGTPQHKYIQRERFPIVLTHHGDHGFPSISVDYEPGMREAVNYLKQKGHARIGLIDLANLDQDFNPKRIAFYNACQQACSEPVLYECANSLAEAMRVGLQIADDPNRPSAIICSSDYLGNAVLNGLHERGVRVPADLAVVGIDGVSMGAMTYPPLTTIAVNPPDFAAKAIELLLEYVENRESPIKNTHYPSWLMVRRSA